MSSVCVDCKDFKQGVEMNVYDTWVVSMRDMSRKSH